MKTKLKSASGISCYITCTVLSAAILFAAKYYMEFICQTAGSYNIVMLFGMPLRDFLLTALLFVAGILAFLTFAFRTYKHKKKRIYPFYLILMGLLWIVLPHISVYTISRFTGTLILQTVSSIAIIANVVFMMISMCCGYIAAIDAVHTAREAKGGDAMLLAGVPTGCGLALLLKAVLTSAVGLNGIMTIIGVLILAVGIIFCCQKDN